LSSGWQPPEGHAIDEAEARALTSGDYGIEAARLTMSCCLPLFWFLPDEPSGAILNTGTVTLVRPADRTFGITAAHVIRGYQEDLKKNTLGALLGDADIPPSDNATFRGFPVRLVRSQVNSFIANLLLRRWPEAAGGLRLCARAGPISNMG